MATLSGCGMLSRFHLQGPDLASAIDASLSGSRDFEFHHRLLAKPVAASEEFAVAQIAVEVGYSRRAHALLA